MRKFTFRDIRFKRSPHWDKLRGGVGYYASNFRSLSTSLLTLENSTVLENGEEYFKTGSMIARSFHSILMDPMRFTSSIPFVLLGLEGISRKAAISQETELSYLQSSFDFSPTLFPDYWYQKHPIRGYLSKQRVSVVTHIAVGDLKHRNGISQYLPKVTYNAYQHIHSNSKDAPANLSSTQFEESGSDGGFIERGIHAVASLRSSIREIIEVNRITHIVVVSWGWNVTQADAFHFSNSLIAKLHFDTEIRQPFNPLLICMTWPSTSYGVFGSLRYTHCANEADRVGALFGATLLHKVILPIRDTVSPETRIIMIGHSFGARCLSRAIFSGAFIKATSPVGLVDLFVALQGAFSLNRFIIGRYSWEKAPYRTFRSKIRKVAITASDFDRAVLFSWWVRHCGNMKSFRDVARTTTARIRNMFDLIPVDIDGNFACPDRFLTDRKIAYFDTTNIMKYRAGTRTAVGHGDVLNTPVSRFIGKLISLV